MKRTHILLSLLPLFGGCSTGTDPGPCEEMQCRRITDLMIVHRGVYLYNDSLRSFFNAKAIFEQNPGLVDQHFLHPGSGGEYISSVELNGIKLRVNGLEPESKGYFYALNDVRSDSVLAPNGEWNRWVVRGRFHDSISFEFKTPHQTPEITVSPTYPDDTLSAESDLHITWPSGSVWGEERNSVFIVLHGDSATKILSYNSPDSFNFTDQSEVTIPGDSVKAWSSQFESIQIQLEHYSIRDSALTESSWARTIMLDRDVRLLHFPTP